jgi:hypothetical protein
MLLSISELKYDHQNSNCLPYIIWRQSTTYVDHWRPITFDLRLYNVNSVQVICNHGDIHGISQDIFSLWWWFIDSHDNGFCCFPGSDWNWTERTGVLSRPIRAGHKSLLHSFGPFISGPIFGKLVPYSLHLMYSLSLHVAFVCFRIPRLSWQLIGIHYSPYTRVESHFLKPPDIL